MRTDITSCTRNDRYVRTVRCAVLNLRDDEAQVLLVSKAICHERQSREEEGSEEGGEEEQERGGGGGEDVEDDEEENAKGDRMKTLINRSTRLPVPSQVVRRSSAS